MKRLLCVELDVQLGSLAGRRN